MSKLWAILTGHAHHWGVPHPDEAGEIVQDCYECGKRRKVQVDLRAEATWN